MMDIRQKILDIEQAVRGPLKQWGWIAVTAILVACLAVVVAEKHVAAWIFRLAQIVLVGASTAVFTRFLGGMGMYLDAIAKTMGDDAWLDRRKDLDDLWRKITRRIVLPGFQEGTADHDALSREINKAMNKFINKADRKNDYYQRDMKRRIAIKWDDEARRTIRIEDYLNSHIVPFDVKEGCRYEPLFKPATGEHLSSYAITMEYFKLDGSTLRPEDIKPETRGNERLFPITLKGRPSFNVERKMVYIQKIDDDPTFFCLAAKGVIWGLEAAIQTHDLLRVTFEEVGLENDFECLGEDRPDHIERLTKVALLPEQGFQLVITERAEPGVLAVA